MKLIPLPASVNLRRCLKLNIQEEPATEETAVEPVSDILSWRATWEIESEETVEPVSEPMVKWPLPEESAVKLAIRKFSSKDRAWGVGSIRAGTSGSNSSCNRVGRAHIRVSFGYISRVIYLRSRDTKAAEVTWPASDVSGELIFENVSKSATTW